MPILDNNKKADVPLLVGKGTPKKNLKREAGGKIRNYDIPPIRIRACSKPGVLALLWMLVLARLDETKPCADRE